MALNTNERKPMEPGTLLLPPATNWFCSGSTDAREQDRLLVTGAFKSIVLYRIPVGAGAPTVLKSIFHSGSKVLHVKLYPDAEHPQYGPCLLATSDQGAVTLYNAETGVAALQHKEHDVGCVHGVCWSTSTSTGEVSVVSVGTAGTLVVWNVELNITKKVFLNPAHRGTVAVTPQPDVTLTLVEPVPGLDSTLIVAAEKVLVLFDFKNTRVLSLLRGHDHTVYCMRWWTSSDPSVSSPFPDSLPLNSRAEGLRDGFSADRGVSDKGAAGSTGVTGRYLASSDLGGNVLVWDVVRRRYVYRTQISGGSKVAGGRNYRKNLQHCALAWYGNCLLGNTVSGVVVSLPLSENSLTVTKDNAGNALENGSSSHKSCNDWRSNSSDWRSKKDQDKSSVPRADNADLKSKIIHQEHTRVIFNLNVIGTTLVSSGHDRNLIGYDLDVDKVQFCLPTLGGAVNSIAFDPRDSSWLALGLQENCIRLVKLNSSPPLRSKLISNGIRGKVLSLSWHPEEDGFLLYGTSDGQVGIANVNTGKVTAFSFFHQKAVYKVEWGPAVLRDVHPEYAKVLCAYSFGDREITMRNPNAPMDDPVKLTVGSSLPGHATEFSFSPDHKYFAVGCHDGSVSIHRSLDLAVLLRIVVVRKTIQHLLWKPIASSDGSEQTTPYVLAVGSSESKICLLDLTNQLPEQSEKYSEFQLKSTTASNENAQSTNETVPQAWQPLIVSTCTRELCGHAGRVVYLSFSPNDPNLLASASYDHTCQIWDSNSGEQLGNYRGHLSRLYRVEFSPSEPGLLFSFGEENCVHQWRLADLTEKSPPEKLLKVKDVRPQIAVGEKVERQEAPSTKVSSKGDAKSKTSKHIEASSATVGSKRTPAHRSLFPMLHQASCHKRSFYLLGILCIYEQKKLELQQQKQAEELSVEDMLAAAEEVGNEGPFVAPALGSASAQYRTALDTLGDTVFDADDQVPSQEDLTTFVDFYGNSDQTIEFLDKQISSHMNNNNFAAAAPLQLWRGTSEPLVRHAISAKSVTPDIVVQAMHFSRQLGEIACEAYSHQLAAAGDPLSASSYLVLANKVTEAIELLLLHKLYREALVLAKTRRPCSLELHESIARSFASNCLHEGNLDIAVVLLASLGDAVEAASTLCRRGDPSSLTVAGLLYAKEGHPLAQATLLEAIRTAGYKGQLDKVLPTVLKTAPQYRWFSLIAAAVKEMAELLTTVKARTSEEVLNINRKSRALSSDSSASAIFDADSSHEKENESLASSPSEVHEKTKMEDAPETGTTSEEEAPVSKTIGGDASENGIVEAENGAAANVEVTCKERHKGYSKSPAVPYTPSVLLANYLNDREEDLLERIWTTWMRDFQPSELPALHTSLCSTLSASLKPSTLKQYEFLLGAEITKLLLRLGGPSESGTSDVSCGSCPAPRVDDAASVLQSALQLALDWNRFDQLFELTHILLPKGPDEPPAILAPLFKCGPESAPHASASLLCKLYSLAEHVQQLNRCYTPFVPSSELSVSSNLDSKVAGNCAESVQSNDTANGKAPGEVETKSCVNSASDNLVSPIGKKNVYGEAIIELNSLSSGSSAGDKILSLASDVAASCGGGDEAKIKRIFNDISGLLSHLNIQPTTSQ